MSNLSRDENPKVELKKMIEIKNSIIEMRNTFNELIRSLDTDKERKCELEDISTKT